MGQKPKTFTREATGLVRELSANDTLMYNLMAAAGGPFIGLAIYSFNTWYGIPGADLAAVVVMATLFGFLGWAGTYAGLGASMPRSGGEYVFQSRIIHPSVGFAVNLVYYFTQCGSFATVAGMITWWGISPGFYMAGLQLNNAALIDFASWATTLQGTTVIGSLFYLVCGMISTVGTKYLVRYFLGACFVLSYIGVIAMILFLSMNTHASYVSLFDSFMDRYSQLPNAYQTIMGSFKDAGYELMAYDYSPAILLAGLGITGWANLYGWSCFASGEIKGASSLKKQIYMMGSAAVVTGIFMFILAELTNIVIGYDLPRALTVLSIDRPDLIPGLVFNWGAVSSFLIYLTAPNAGVTALYTVSTIAMTLAFGPVFYMILTRIFFAMSFDRMLPAALSDVSDRFHTPIKATVVSFIATELVFLLFTWSGEFHTFVIMISVLGVFSILVTTLSGVIFPFRKKVRSIYDSSPLKNWKVVGIPVIVITGLIGAFYAGDCVYQLLTLPLLGFGSEARYVGVLSYIVALVLYFIIRAIRKAQGIDLGLVFSEIPPE